MKILDKFKLVFRVINDGKIELLKATNGSSCEITDFDVDLIQNMMSYILEDKIDTGEDRFIGNFESHIHEPEYAVHYSLSDYSVRTTTRHISEIIRCPKCGKYSDQRHHHGDTYQCGGCKIKITTYGNSLYLYY
jgi:ribosomal protein S27AE